MPNWCECDLFIEGRTNKVEEFLGFARSDELIFDFHCFIPYPEHFQTLDRIAAEWEKEHPGEWQGRPLDGYNQGGCDWCVLNWGTKWNAVKPRLNEETDTRWEEAGAESRRLKIDFKTAWTPPKPVVKRAAELFPDIELDLRYFEGGFRFNGMFFCKDGVVMADEEGDYYGDRGG
jgi:hypothetical protein